MRKLSFVAPGAHVDFFIKERLFVQNRRFLRPVIFPSGDVTEVFIIALGFAFGGLKLLAEMAAAGFAAVQGIQTEQLGELHEIRHPPGIFEALV